jgi:dual specificity tyrosine-phosphorylation-regulated kinase 2/3/4
MATPEYMPPEILNYILFQNSAEYDQLMLKKMALYKHPWIIDVWSLGCILLEIVSGVPLWMSVRTRTPSNQMALGLFAVKNRVFSRVIQKQVEVVQDLDHHLINHVRFSSCRTIRASCWERTSRKPSKVC